MLDTSGVALAAALDQGGCELVKPSLSELEYLVGGTLSDPAEQDGLGHGTGAARRRPAGGGHARGARAPCWPPQDGVLRMPAMDVPMHSSVGAGDAFLAAARLALARGATPVDALAWGTAAGATAIACAGTARLRQTDVEARYRAFCCAVC